MRDDGSVHVQVQVTIKSWISHIVRYHNYTKCILPILRTSKKTACITTSVHRQSKIKYLEKVPRDIFV